MNHWWNQMKNVRENCIKTVWENCTTMIRENYDKPRAIVMAFLWSKRIKLSPLEIDIHDKLKKLQKRNLTTTGCCIIQVLNEFFLKCRYTQSQNLNRSKLGYLSMTLFCRLDLAGCATDAWPRNRNRYPTIKFWYFENLRKT